MQAAAQLASSGPSLSASLLGQLEQLHYMGATSSANIGEHQAALHAALCASLALPNNQQQASSRSGSHYNHLYTTLANSLNETQSMTTNQWPRLNTGGGGGGPLPLTWLAMGTFEGPVRKIDQFLDYYFTDLWKNKGDERTSQLPLMGGGPWKLIYATLIYLTLIKWLLPKAMRNSHPLELNWPIRIYNSLMVASNLYAFYHGTRILNWGLKCFGCEVIDHKDYKPETMELLHYGWLFFLSRLLEWLDTIFFVLRKKERQVTKLHVFHHSFVPLISWVYLKFHPGYSVAFFPYVNSFVHSVMYTYYLLATFGPEVQRHLWWKRHLTSLQIGQFVLILVQLFSIPLSANDKCHYPRGFLYAAFAGAVLFLWLFFTYYLDTYGRKQQQQQQRNATKATNSTATNRSMIKLGREGSSRALSDAIDNAIDSGFEDSPRVKFGRKLS